MRAERVREPPLAADDPPAVLFQLGAVRTARAQVLTLAHQRADLLVQLLDLGHGRNVATRCYERVKIVSRICADREDAGPAGGRRLRRGEIG